MNLLHGVAGHPGSPARLPTEGLDDRGVRGSGRLQVGSRRGRELGTLEWLPEKSTESSVLGRFPRDFLLTTSRKGGAPGAILPNRSGLEVESVYEPHGDERGRLTGPIQFVLKLLEFWRLEPTDAVRMLGFDHADAGHVAAVLAGNEQFRGRDVRDRISHLFWIRNTLWSLFRDLEVENDWLREPHSMLDDRAPLSLLLGGSMDDLLLAREYVDAVAGR